MTELCWTSFPVSTLSLVITVNSYLRAQVIIFELQLSMQQTHATVRYCQIHLNIFIIFYINSRKDIWQLYELPWPLHVHVSTSHCRSVIAAPSWLVFHAPCDTSSGHNFLGHLDVCAILIYILAGCVGWLV